LKSNLFVSFFTDRLIVGLVTHPQDMASILLAVVEQGVPSGQGPPWSLAKLVCSGGDVFVVAAVLACYDNKTTFCFNIVRNNVPETIIGFRFLWKQPLDILFI